MDYLYSPSHASALVSINAHLCVIGGLHRCTSFKSLFIWFVILYKSDTCFLTLPRPRCLFDIFFLRGLQYGASAPSTPIQRPLPSPMAPTATVPAAAPPATAPPSTGTAAPPSSSQGKVAEESRESHAPPSDAESQAVVSTMNSMLGALTEAPLSVPEKKMLGDVTKVFWIF